MADCEHGEHTVYLVEGDVEGFRGLAVDPASPLTWRAGADGWEPLPVIEDDPTLPRPDVWRVSTLPKTFAMGPEVIERLEPFVAMAGELLPMSVHGWTQELFALDLTEPTAVDVVLDVARDAVERRQAIERHADFLTPDDLAALLAALDRGDPWPVLYPAFREHEICALAPTFFAIGRLSGAWFVHDHAADDTLLRRIADFGITGLAFTRLWSSVDGPEAVNLFRP